MSDLSHPPNPNLSVPPELVNDLHEATEAFKRKRQQIDAVHEDFNAELDQREAAILEMHEADEDLEKIRRKIEGSITPDQPPVDRSND